MCCTQFDFICKIGLSRKEQPFEAKITLLELLPSIDQNMKRQALQLYWLAFSDDYLQSSLVAKLLPKVISGICTKIDSVQSLCVLVLNTIDLLLKRESVRMLPFVPNSYKFRAIFSSTVFDTKCNQESSVRQIRALICRAKSYTSNNML